MVYRKPGPSFPVLLNTFAPFGFPDFTPRAFAATADFFVSPETASRSRRAQPGPTAARHGDKLAGQELEGHGCHSAHLLTCQTLVAQVSVSLGSPRIGDHAAGPALQIPSPYSGVSRQGRCPPVEDRPRPRASHPRAR